MTAEAEGFGDPRGQLARRHQHQRTWRPWAARHGRRGVQVLQYRNANGRRYRFAAASKSRPSSTIGMARA
jgi:hypothetical protein